jgi:CheY-like chemotaxis protein
MTEKIKIMIVDDNEANLKLAGDLLEMEGLDIYRCINAENALSTLDHVIPDLILMDLALPGIDGLQLTRQLKTRRGTSDIKIVALTASAMKGDKERILAAGCDGYIAKPIDTRKFKEQVLQHLGLE